MNKHGKERLIPLQGKGKSTTMGSRMGSSPSSAGFAITSLLAMSQSLNLWACLVPLSLDLLTPHLEGLNVHCPLYTHTHAHSGQDYLGLLPQKQEPGEWRDVCV